MENNHNIIYCRNLSPKPMPWYLSVLTVLGTAAALWVLVTAHNLTYYLPLDQTTRAAVDVVLLLIACALALGLFVWRCTQYKYILTKQGLTLQTVRGSRVVKQLYLSGELTVTPLCQNGNTKNAPRFCYKGHPNTAVITGKDEFGKAASAIFAPDEQLTKKLTNTL